MNAVIRHLTEEHGMTVESAEQAMAGWDILPIMSGDTTVGHLAKQESEIHTVLFPEYRGTARNRAVIRLYHQLLKENAFLTTRIPLDDVADIPLTEGVGFREVRRDSQFIFYWMDQTTVIGGRKNAP